MASRVLIGSFLGVLSLPFCWPPLALPLAPRFYLVGFARPNSVGSAESIIANGRRLRAHNEAVQRRR